MDPSENHHEDKFHIKSTDVAYGCDLTSVIDYMYLLLLFPLDGDERRVVKLGGKDIRYGIVGAKGPSLCRGRTSEEGVMKNCIMLDYLLEYDEVKVKVSVKVFKRYLHFCRESKTKEDNSREMASVLADDVLRIIKETQIVMENRELLSARLDQLLVDDYLTEEGRLPLEDRARTSRLCVPDLERTEIIPTMSNHIVSFGTPIHTTKLIKIIQAHQCKTRPWILTFDNSLLMVIRILVPYRDTMDNDGYRFTIHPTGNLSYSNNDMDEEAALVRKEVLTLVRDSIPLISIGIPNKKSTPKMQPVKRIK